MYAMMDEVYEILIHKVHDYEGTVNEMTGDGVMALFGAPIALEDAPQRAIRSAMAIHREMTRFNEKSQDGRKGISHLSRCESASIQALWLWAPWEMTSEWSSRQWGIR